MNDPQSEKGNAFETELPGTPGRDRSEALIEGVRGLGGVFVEAVRATRLPMVLTDPALPGNPIVFANESFLALSGYGMEEVLGQQPYFMNGRDTDPADAERFRNILENDSDGTVETVQYRKDGSAFVASLLLSAFKSADGETIHHFLTWTDVTRRVEAEEDAASLRRTQAALVDSEAKYHALFESMDEAYAVVELLKDERGHWVDFRFLEVNPAFLEHTAMPWPVGKTASELLGSPNPRWIELYAKALETGEPLRVEETESALGRTFDLNIFSLDRERNRVAVLFTNITDRKKAEEAQRERAEWLRLILENAQDYAIFTTDLEGRITDWWGGAEAVFGYSEEEIIGCDFAMLFTPEDNLAGAPAEERAIASREGKAPNVRWHVCKDGRRVFIEGICSALVEKSGKLSGFLKIGRDATERHAADRRQKLLLAELQHRVRNVLGMIRSVVRQSSEGYDDLDEFVAHLIGRLDAMGRTQVLLTRSAEAQVDLEGLVRDRLEYQLPHGAEIRISGPSVSLEPRAAEVLTLALHELATNSIKYGALSDPEGQLSVTWGIAPMNGEPWLQLIWEERCSQVEPRAIKPGFGTELIEERVPYELKGEAVLNITDGGVLAEIAFPLREAASTLETGSTAGEVT